MFQPHLTKNDFNPSFEVLPEGIYETKIGKIETKPGQVHEKFNPDGVDSTDVMLEVIKKAGSDEVFENKCLHYYIMHNQMTKWAKFYEACGYSEGWILKHGTPKEEELLDTLIKVKVRVKESDRGQRNSILMKDFMLHAKTKVKQLEEEDIPF